MGFEMGDFITITRLIEMKQYFKIIYSFLLYLRYQITFKFFDFGRNKFILENDSILIRTKISIKGKGNVLIIEKGCVIRDLSIIIVGDNNLIQIKKAVKVDEGGQFLIEGNNCNVSIGSKTTIGSANLFCGESNTFINLGEDCMLSTKINIDTSDFHSILDINTGLRINHPNNVVIEDHVWIGFGAQILKGAVINKNSIVAAKALVTGKEYPSHVVLAGIPAKVQKENINWSREKIT